MTKKEITKLVYANTELHQLQSREAVQATIEALSKVLLKYGRVELRGFGVFMIKTRSERKARNPRTGQEVWVEEHDTVVFKPSKLLKAELDAKRAAKLAKKAKKSKKEAGKAKKETAVKAAPKKDVKTAKKEVKTVKKVDVKAAKDSKKVVKKVAKKASK